MGDLKPCPICGSEVESSIAYTASMINCKNENCIMIGCLMDNEPWVDEIEKRWNERPGEDRLEKELNTLKAQLKREMAVTNMAAMDLPNQALELARETVKARGEFRKDE